MATRHHYIFASVDLSGNSREKLCQKWDSNPRPHTWTRILLLRKESYSWVWRLRPLGHPDMYVKDIRNNQYAHIQNAFLKLYCLQDGVNFVLILWEYHLFYYLRHSVINLLLKVCTIVSILLPQNDKSRVNSPFYEHFANKESPSDQTRQVNVGCSN